jgi:hypothetical protein
VQVLSEGYVMGLCGEAIWWLPFVAYIMFMSRVHPNTLSDVSLCFPEDGVSWGHHM